MSKPDEEKDCSCYTFVLPFFSLDSKSIYIWYMFETCWIHIYSDLYHLLI